MAFVDDSHITLVDPRSGARVGELPVTPVATIADRVAAARVAGAAWAARPLEERKAAVKKLASVFMGRAADLARTLEEEIG